MFIDNLKFIVNVDGEPLDEFALKQEGQPAGPEGCKQAACFVASQTGKAFVLIGQNDTDTLFAYDIYIDGKVARRTYVPARSETVTKGTRIDEATRRPFLFESITLTDDDAFLDTPTVSLNELGTIRIDVYRAHRPRKHSTWISENVSKGVGDVPVVHERMKKAGGHCVSLGAPIHSLSTGSVDVQYIDKHPECPYARFIFTYRSKDILQAQGILSTHKIALTGKACQNPPNREEATPHKAGVKRPNEAQADDRNVKAKTDDKENLEIEKLLASEKAALDAKIRQYHDRRMKREPSPIALGSLKSNTIDLTIDV